MDHTSTCYCSGVTVAVTLSCSSSSRLVSSSSCQKLTTSAVKNSEPKTRREAVFSFTRIAGKWQYLSCTGFAEGRLELLLELVEFIHRGQRRQVFSRARHQAGLQLLVLAPQPADLRDHLLLQCKNQTEDTGAEIQEERWHTNSLKIQELHLGTHLMISAVGLLEELRVGDGLVPPNQIGQA
jgi:hypothetical protein